MQNENNRQLPIVKQYKTNKEVIVEMVDLVFEAFSKQSGGNMLMLKPALNIGKMKLSEMTEPEAENLVLQIHKISNLIEKETGVLSPFHCID